MADCYTQKRDLMSKNTAQLNALGFFERLARTGKPSRGFWFRITCAIACLTAAFYLIGGHPTSFVPIVVCLEIVIVGSSYHSRQIERMRRGKEILDRYGPERNRRPLGI